MGILNNNNVNTNHTLKEYRLGYRSNFCKFLFKKRKPYEKYWVSLIECLYPLFKDGSIEIFLEIKHPLGSYENYEIEFNDIIQNNKIYYEDENKFIVIRNADLLTLKNFIEDFYDQGILILMSQNKLNASATDVLIKKINKNVFKIKESIEEGFNIAIEFNFPSGKEVYIVSNIEDDRLEGCFQLIK